MRKHGCNTEEQLCDKLLIIVTVNDIKADLFLVSRLKEEVVFTSALQQFYCVMVG